MLTKLTFKEVKTDKLFLGKFEYCVGFAFDEVSALRIYNKTIPDEFRIRETLEKRKHYRSMFLGLTLNNQKTPLSKDEIDNVVALGAYFQSHKTEIRYHVSINYIWVYTNNLDIVSDLSTFSGSYRHSIKRALVVKELGAITLKNPKFKFRTYLRFQKFDDVTKAAFVQQLKNNAENLCASKGLQKFLEYDYSCTQDHHFIDHNEEKWILILYVVCPGVVRKTLPIVKAKY